MDLEIGSLQGDERESGFHNPDSLFLLGREYILGERVPPDLLRGVTYLQRAATRGHVEAAYTLASVLDEGFSRDVVYHKTSVLRGNERLKSRRAIPWYTKAANMGCVKSCARLVEIYFLPRLSKANIKRGIRYFAGVDEVPQKEELTLIVFHAIQKRLGPGKSSQNQFPKNCGCGIELKDLSQFMEKIRVSGIQEGQGEFNLLIGNCLSCLSTIAIRVLPDERVDGSVFG